MKPDESRQRYLLFFRKTILRIKNEEGPIYLIRYSLLTTPWFAIKLHKILLSDDDCMHDHPWSFISIILKGGYYEFTPNRHGWFYGPGSILWRPQPWIHRLEVNDLYGPTISLVITFKKVRIWGFITPKGWKPWYEYIREGRKCE